MDEEVSIKCSKCGKILKGVEPHKCTPKTLAAAGKPVGGTGKPKENHTDS